MGEFMVCELYLNKAFYKNQSGTTIQLIQQVYIYNWIMVFRFRTWIDTSKANLTSSFFSFSIITYHHCFHDGYTEFYLVYLRKEFFKRLMNDIYDYRISPTYQTFLATSKQWVKLILN